MEPGQLEELHTQGWTLVRGLVPCTLTSQARGLADAIIGGSDAVERVPSERGQPGPWPAAGETLPVITSSNFKHSINHPIDDSAYGFEGLLAKLLLPMIGINRALLRCDSQGEKGGSAGGLRLMQQFLRRTDVGPPPHHGCSGGPPPAAWHQDQGFLPAHYEAAPRQMFFHSILALTDVLTDGGAFFASPSSLSQARAITATIPPIEHADETRTKLRQLLTPQLDNSDGTSSSVSYAYMYVQYLLTAI
jgi:hypothetical protein